MSIQTWMSIWTVASEKVCYICTNCTLPYLSDWVGIIWVKGKNAYKAKLKKRKIFCDILQAVLRVQPVWNSLPGWLHFILSGPEGKEYLLKEVPYSLKHWKERAIHSYQKLDDYIFFHFKTLYVCWTNQGSNKPSLRWI